MRVSFISHNKFRPKYLLMLVQQFNDVLEVAASASRNLQKTSPYVSLARSGLHTYVKFMTKLSISETKGILPKMCVCWGGRRGYRELLTRNKAGYVVHFGSQLTVPSTVRPFGNLTATHISFFLHRQFIQVYSHPSQRR